MDKELRALGRRAVVKRDFMRKEWRGAKVHPVLKDGTVDIEAEGRVIAAGPAQPPVVYWLDLRETRSHHPTVHLLPDLSDPATLGCLLALVREAYQDDGFAAFKRSASKWSAEGLGCSGTWARIVKFEAPTYAAALVAALEAAP